MSLKLQDINKETDFPALARYMFETYEDPPQKFFHLFFPIFGSDTTAREAAIEEAADRLKSWCLQDPTVTWKKVVDTETGRIAGAATWNTHLSNPFANTKPPSAYWFPDDGSRHWAEQALVQYATPRIQHVPRPHQYLFIIFTHPSYRRQGVGQQLMDACLANAEEHGLDTYLDSTPVGRPFYEVNGFQYIQENTTAPQNNSPDAEWKEMDDKVGPFTFWLMLKPLKNVD
ncbi:hypothetical protein Golomagni_06446 [Golovinomyces magnicellulatus]|nr:hypothetical protein Golomagni_06446 [Golovinomyces magnicellulatus]